MSAATCYTQILEVRSCLLGDLEAMKRMILSKDPSGDHISKLCRNLGTYDWRLRGMAVQMRSAPMSSDNEADPESIDKEEDLMMLITGLWR